MCEYCSQGKLNRLKFVVIMFAKESVSMKD